MNRMIIVHTRIEILITIDFYSGYLHYKIVGWLAKVQRYIICVIEQYTLSVPKCSVRFCTTVLLYKYINRVYCMFMYMNRLYCIKL